MTPEQISAHVLDVLRNGFAPWLAPEVDDETREFATRMLEYAELNHAQGTLPEFVRGMYERLAPQGGD